MSLDKSMEERKEFFEALFIVTKALLDNSKMNKILFKNEKKFLEGAFKDLDYIEELYYRSCNVLEVTTDFKKQTLD